MSTRAIAKRGNKLTRPRAPKVASANVAHYTKLKLEDYARKLVSAPDGLSKYQYWEIARYLSLFAGAPAALKAIKTKPKRGSPKIHGERNYKAVLDYVVTRERLKLTNLGKAPVAQEEVGRAWGMGRTQLTSAHTEYRKSEHWKQWAEIERNSIALAHPNLAGSELLAAISRSLRP